MSKKNTNIPFIVIILLCAFFFLGCTKEEMIRPKGHSKIIFTTAFDTDGDTIADMKFYEFQPISIGEDRKVMFQRTMVVGTDKYKIKIKQLKNISSEQINELENLLFQFEANMTDGERDCREATGLTFGSINGRCSSIQSCFANCVSPQCAAFSSSSNMVGYWIKDFSDNSYKLKQKLKNIHTLLVALQNDMSLRKDILEDLNDVLNYINHINSNPIMNPKLIGICQSIPYKVELIGKAMGMLGDYERKAESYRYVVFLKIYTSSQTYQQIAVEDQIPQAIRDNILSFTKIEGQYTNSPITGNISATQLVLVSGMPEYLAYSIESKCPPREDVLEEWPLPATSVEVFDPLQNQYVKMAFEGFKAIYTYFQYLDFYLAFGITTGIIISCMFLIIFVFRIFLALIVPIFKNQSIKKGIVDWLGWPFLYWREYVVLLAILSIITFITDWVLSDHKKVYVLTFNAINERFSYHLPCVIPTVLATITTTLIYILFENMLRTILLLSLATPRKMIKENSKKANEIRLKTLKEDIDHLKAIIQQHKEQVDLSEEESLAESIPIDRLEEMVEQRGNEEHTKAILENYMKKVEKALLDAEEKIKIMDKYWEDWVSYVKKKIRRRNVVFLTEFARIPHKWRRWVLWQMIQRNCISGWNIEGNTLKRIGESKDIDEKDARIVREKVVIGMMKINEEKVTMIFTKKGNSTVVKFLIKRINAYVENILRILKRNNRKFKVRMHGKKIRLIEKKENKHYLAVWEKIDEIGEKKR